MLVEVIGAVPGTGCFHVGADYALPVLTLGSIDVCLECFIESLDRRQVFEIDLGRKIVFLE